MLVLPIPCRPSARTVARLRAMWLIVLLIWVTLSLAATVATSVATGAGWPAIRLTSLTPRRAPSSSAECRLRSASIVARVTLTGLVEPWILDRMSRTPAASRTARTEPPAMTPVPCEAGLSRTLLAP